MAAATWRRAPSRSESAPGGTAPGAPALFNVAFRTAEPLPDVSNALAGITIGDAAAGARVDATWWRERAQSAALASGDISRFSAQVDFAKLGSTVRRLQDAAAHQGLPRGVPAPGDAAPAAPCGPRDRARGGALPRQGAARDPGDGAAHALRAPSHA